MDPRHRVHEIGQRVLNLSSTHGYNEQGSTIVVDKSRPRQLLLKLTSIISSDFFFSLLFDPQPQTPAGQPIEQHGCRASNNNNNNDNTGQRGGGEGHGWTTVITASHCRTQNDPLDERARGLLTSLLCGLISGRFMPFILW